MCLTFHCLLCQKKYSFVQWSAILLIFYRILWFPVSILVFFYNSCISKLSITVYIYIFTVLNDFTFLRRVFFLKNLFTQEYVDELVLFISRLSEDLLISLPWLYYEENLIFFMLLRTYQRIVWGSICIWVWYWKVLFQKCLLSEFLFYVLTANIFFCLAWFFFNQNQSILSLKNMLSFMKLIH